MYNIDTYNDALAKYDNLLKDFELPPRLLLANIFSDYRHKIDTYWQNPIRIKGQAYLDMLQLVAKVEKYCFSKVNRFSIKKYSDDLDKLNSRLIIINEIQTNRYDHLSKIINDIDNLSVNFKSDLTSNINLVFLDRYKNPLLVSTYGVYVDEISSTIYRHDNISELIVNAYIERNNVLSITTSFEASVLEIDVIAMARNSITIWNYYERIDDDDDSDSISTASVDSFSDITNENSNDSIFPTFTKHYVTEDNYHRFVYHQTTPRDVQYEPKKISTALEKIIKLTNLNCLKIIRAQIPYDLCLQESLGLPNLEKLSLETVCVPCVLSLGNNVKFVDISNCVEILQSIRLPESLTSLIISNSKVTTNQILSLSILNSLNNLCLNNLLLEDTEATYKKLGESFSNLKELRITNHKRIKTIDFLRGFVNNKSLDTIDLYGNNISTSDILWLDCFPNIRVIMLGRNPIDTLPVNFMGVLANLEVISFRDCLIRSLGDYQFKGLCKIEYIDLRNNHISTVSNTAFKDLPMLNSVDLRTNNVWVDNLSTSRYIRVLLTQGVLMPINRFTL